MIRIERGEEIDRHGKWRWMVGVLSGVSRQPLLDACRALQRTGADLQELAGLFRQGRDKADITCAIGVGAGLTVEETGPRFGKWQPYAWARG